MSSGQHMLHLVPPGPARTLYAPLVSDGLFEPEDLLVASRTAARVGESRPHALLAASLAIRATRHGSTCARLDRAGALIRRDRRGRFDEDEWVRLPKELLDACRIAVQASALTSGTRSPFVSDGPRLFARRYDSLEAEIPRRLAQVGTRAPRLKSAIVNRGVDALFAEETTGNQAIAVRAALASGATLLTGGPGTGKTYTVRMLLSVAYGEAILRGEALPRVLLAAPTGKAALRVSESLRSGLEELRDGKLTQWLGTRAHDVANELEGLEATTLHRMLGWQRRTPTRFRYDENNPLRADWVVVDEASMIDLPLMARLLRALHSSTRLVIIGDPDQLPSVGPGSVLADIAAQHRLPKRVHHARLARRRRFGEDSEIAQCADAIAAGSNEFERFLRADERREVCVASHEDARHAASWVAKETIEHAVHVMDMIGHASPEEILASSNQRQVLCAHRRGTGSVEDLNTRVIQSLRRRGLVPNEHDAILAPGVPIIVRVNDPALGVFNGDVGVCVPSDSPGAMQVFFGDGRFVRPRRLPAFDLAYALTVHQSQGSEFEHVLVSLPFRDSPLLSRGLLYTAVTRARKSVTLVGSLEAIAEASDREEHRYGSLRGRF